MACVWFGGMTIVSWDFCLFFPPFNSQYHFSEKPLGRINLTEIILMVKYFCDTFIHGFFERILKYFTCYTEFTFPLKLCQQTLEIILDISELEGSGSVCV